MVGFSSEEQIRCRYRALKPEMDERMRRQWAAAEAQALGWGGMKRVALATGLSRHTIRAGLVELALPPDRRQLEARRVRRPGGGRHSLSHADPQLLGALDALIEPSTRGDP